MGITSQKSAHPWPFFALTFSLSWSFWILAIWSSNAGITGLSQALHYLGGAMPLVSALFLLYAHNTPEKQRDFWLRAFDLRRISVGWYGVIFFIVPALTGLGWLFDRILGGTGLQSNTGMPLTEQGLNLIPLALFLLIFGPLPEELAWRGYALDRLQARKSALVSSLILGSLWTIWHLPLFWIQGSYQNSLGIGTPTFWLFMLDKIPQSVIMTWVYNNNRRSTLSAILIHFMVNYIGELFDLTRQAEAYQVFLWWVSALGVTAFWGAATLTRIESGTGD